MASQPQAGGGMMSGLAGTVMTGMAFGAGSEIAHQGVRAMMGTGSGGGHAPAQEGGQAQTAPAGGQQYEQQQDFSQEQQQPHPCMDFNTSFIQCLKMNQTNIDSCQSYMNMLQQCESDYQLKQQNFQ